MVYKIHNWAHKFYSIFSTIKPHTMNLDKCYFRYVQREDKIDVMFLLKIKDKIRQFNLSRNPSESLELLVARIGTNIHKVVNKKSKKNINKEDTQVEVKLYDFKNNSLPLDTTCKELFDLKNPLQLKIFNNVYEAVFNAPWVLSLNLPHSILVGFPIYPENLEIQYARIENSTFNWYRGITLNNKRNDMSDVHIKWELAASSYSYIPKAEDIGMKLKLECIPGNDKTVGPVVETISKNVVEAGPGQCPFETRHMFTTEKLKNKRFRCVSYNILADLYCDSDFTRTVLHPYCPPYALHIDYRKQLLTKEILGYNADIICLQEVDMKIFKSYLSPLLLTEGLEGLFYRKGKEVAEGLACFYNKERFNYLGDDKILLAEAIQTRSYLKFIWDIIENNQPLKRRLLDRSTVASATYLQSKDDPNEILIVGNTHLYFHPDADHIRLIQGGILIYWLADLKQNMLEKFSGKRISIILCGDFNSVPSCGVYQLFTTGIAPNTLPDWKSNLDEAVDNLTFQQKIPLRSACGTPPFTNFTAEFADCLDYIYYEESNLEVEQVVPFPSEEELRSHIALPSIVFPSDHIALISDLRFA